MSDYISKFVNSEFGQRLVEEHQLLDDFCKKNSKVEYYVTKRFKKKRFWTRKKLLPPIEYDLEFNTRSILSIDKNNNPIYLNKHIVNVKIIEDYPPLIYECIMKTDIFHPNVGGASGFRKGYIVRRAMNRPILGWTLPELTQILLDIIEYKIYEYSYEPPYAEDINAARWVEKFGEPKGIVKRYKGIIASNTSFDSQHLNTLLSSNKVEEAINYLLGNYVSLRDDNLMITIKSRYDLLKKQRLQGVMSEENYNINHNKITVDLLELIDSVI